MLPPGYILYMMLVSEWGWFYNFLTTGSVFDIGFVRIRSKENRLLWIGVRYYNGLDFWTGLCENSITTTFVVVVVVVVVTVFWSRCPNQHHYLANRLDRLSLHYCYYFHKLIDTIWSHFVNNNPARRHARDWTKKHPKQPNNPYYYCKYISLACDVVFFSRQFRHD